MHCYVLSHFRLHILFPPLIYELQLNLDFLIRHLFSSSTSTIPPPALEDELCSLSRVPSKLYGGRTAMTQSMGKSFWPRQYMSHVARHNTPTEYTDFRSYMTSVISGSLGSGGFASSGEVSMPRLVTSAPETSSIVSAARVSSSLQLWSDEIPSIPCFVPGMQAAGWMGAPFRQVSAYCMDVLRALIFLCVSAVRCGMG